MLLSRAEFSGWHRTENINEVNINDLLAQFAIVLDQSTSSRRMRSVVSIFFGIVLLAAGAVAGAYRDDLVSRARVFFMPMTAVPTAAALESAAPIAAGPALVAPVVVAAPQAAAPAAVSLEETISSVVNQMRARLPKKIDAITSMLWVENQGTKIIYENQIAMDGAKIDYAKKVKMLQVIVANNCNTPGPRKLLQLGASFRYVYVDINAKPVTTIDVTGRNCI